MIDPSYNALLATAAGVAVLHTAAGPDHYVPFVAMARIGRWSRRKTIAVTIACGIGHVASSVVLGFLGIGLGIAGEKLKLWEDHRGSLAGWLLLGFGIAYLVWGLVRAARGHSHSHVHAHADGTIHAHTHDHHNEHLHVHAPSPDARNPDQAAHNEAMPAAMTPWILFTIFVFGPCEPLIPLLMVAAAKFHWAQAAGVAALFGIVTLSTMLAVVLLMLGGLRLFDFPRLERYSHAAAGAALTACGLAIKLGL